MTEAARSTQTMGVALVIPNSTPFVFSDSAWSILQMYSKAVSAGISMNLLRATSMIRAESRNICIRSALQNPRITHILFCDCDQIYAQSAIVMLAERVMEDQSRKAIGAPVPCRGVMAKRQRRDDGSRPPFIPNVMMVDKWPENGSQDVIHDTLVPEWQRGLTRVDLMGTGFLMVHRDILLSMGAPWFRDAWDPIRYRIITHDDMVFASRLHSMNVSIWCDWDIDINHLDVFHIDRTFQDRFADIQESAELYPLTNLREIERLER